VSSTFRSRPLAVVAALWVASVVAPSSGGHGAVGAVVVAVVVVVSGALELEVEVDARVVEVASSSSSSLLHADATSSPARMTATVAKVERERRTGRF
jgi:hypothetical protein